MKHRITALALTALLVLSSAVGAQATFTDIPDAETAIAAAALEGLGVATGTGGGNFTPNTTLTRAEACTWAVRAMGYSNQVNSHARKTMFSDVSATSWYNGYVNLAYAKGIINGRGDGTFGPNAVISYGELATVLLRMLGYTSADVGAVWPLDYTAFCDDLGLSEGLSLTPYGSMTRGDAAILIYRALKSSVNGTNKPYYETINGVTATSEAILLDTASTYGGGTELLMAYTTGSGAGIAYYNQANVQSAALVGSMGTLLFNGAGRVVGFVPESTQFADVTIGSATASALTDQSGTSYRVSSGATVIAAGETYAYSTGGYLQLAARVGESVRLFYDEDGLLTCLYLAGGTSAGSEVAVASSASASSLARALGIANKNYAITKNGAAASASSLAQYDVGYYDAASGTLRVSDYRVAGFIEAASPNVTAAQTLTVAGRSFTVLESAWETLGSFKLGEKAVLLLTDDNKVAAAYRPSQLTADMIGVLSTDGKSVTLVGSGVTLSAQTVEYDETDLGALVSVSASSSTTLRCSALTSSDYQTLNIAENTVGSTPIAPQCAIYEWAGDGYVYDLEGNRGAASSDLSVIDWTDTLASSYVSYTHKNSAGEVDIILLRNATGSAYQYGSLRIYEGQEGIDLGSGNVRLYTDAATLTNSAGKTGKQLFNVSGTGGYAGVALGQGGDGYGRVVKVQPLYRISNMTAESFYREGEHWYVEHTNGEYRVSDSVEIHITNSDLWLRGEEGLTALLADGYTLTLYYDRAPSEGGQIRLISAAAKS